MPFMKGRAALRRTVDWLEKGQILFRENVKIVTFNYAPDEANHPHHAGLYKFIFWHLPQLKYKNPHVQLITFKMLTPSPWIRAYMDDETKMLIDCDSRSREDIHSHVQTVLGKTQEMLEFEKAQEESIKANPANFGYDFPQQCICEVPGQVPCPAFEKLPRQLLGKYRTKIKNEEATEDEIRSLDFEDNRIGYENEIENHKWTIANIHKFK